MVACGCASPITMGAVAGGDPKKLRRLRHRHEERNRPEKKPSGWLLPPQRPIRGTRTPAGRPDFLSLLCRTLVLACLMSVFATSGLAAVLVFPRATVIYHPRFVVVV
jgi:hypothetical protein